MAVTPSTASISTQHLQALAGFRYTIRRFLHFSEESAALAGVAPQQHQLMLQIAGAPPDAVTSVGYLAERLSLRHHSVVELVGRCEEAGLIGRSRDPLNRRVVILKLTPAGNRILHNLSVDHSRELNELGPELIRALTALIG